MVENGIAGGQNPPAIEFFTTDEILQEERERLQLDADPANVKVSALCLSGGGIRSAAFCLGVVQAFAARGMLRQFHYLSTVSGGGYIGAWLTRCIAEFKGNVRGAETHLATFKMPADHEADDQGCDELIRESPSEPYEITRLRRYTNYLSPSPGIASADAWAGFVLFGRNMLINWAVFAPLLLAAAAVPVCYTALIASLMNLGGLQGLVVYALIGILAAIYHYLASLRVCLLLPSHKRDFDAPAPHGSPDYINRTRLNTEIIRPALVWIFLLPVAFSAVSGTQPPEANPAAQIRGVFFRPPPVTAGTPSGTSGIVVTSSGTLAVEAANPPAKAAASCKHRPINAKVMIALLPLLGLAFSGAAYECAGRKAKWNKSAFSANRLAWWLAAFLSAALLWLGAMLVRNKDPLWLACLGPAWVLAAESLRIIAYVAVRRDGVFGDLDREWLACLSGSKIRTVLGVTAAGGAAVVLPLLVIDNLNSTWTGLTLAATLLSGPLAAIGGMSALTSFLPGAKPAKGSTGILGGLPLDYTFAILAVLFGLLLLMLMGRLAEIIALLPLPSPENCPASDAALFFSLLMFCTALIFSPWLLARAGKKNANRNIADKKNRACKKKFYRSKAMWAVGMVLAIIVASRYYAAQITAALQTVGGWAMGAARWLAIDTTSPSGGDVLPGLTVTAMSGLAAILAVIVAFLIATNVNLNRFSMHGVYRNRLVRAFLGGARGKGQRESDPFTDFDPKDNFRMADAFPRVDLLAKGQTPPNQPAKPLFPVINVTLNRTSGRNQARAERKGAPFTITPFHCGSACLRSADIARPNGAYVETCQYAGGDRDAPHDKCNGITLGTAMTISGAAVSPNTGYNASPFTAFLMTLFNVRLGAWLPNPGRGQGKDRTTAAADLMKLAGPKNAIPTMLQELTGQSDDKGDYIYLSDGGHFDNLGLYEMLRRRCKQIVVVDAGADKKYADFDLGHAMEIARVDLGVQAEFITPMKVGGKKLDPNAAYATIFYPPANPNDEAQTGCLIYLKPWLPDDLPVDLQAYKKLRHDFPHTPTADQFFTESDFEAYRHLGEYLANAMLNMLPAGLPYTLDRLFKQAAKRAEAAKKAAKAKPAAAT